MSWAEEIETTATITNKFLAKFLYSAKNLGIITDTSIRIFELSSQHFDISIKSLESYGKYSNFVSYFPDTDKIDDVFNDFIIRVLKESNKTIPNKTLSRYERAQREENLLIIDTNRIESFLIMRELTN